MEYNPYILIPLASWAIAQITKFALAALKGRIDFRYLYASGGMPSVHSAVVSSLATTALLVDGVGSHIFGLSLVMAAIVMYDSFGVRRSSGEQAMAINMLIDSLDRSKIRLERSDLHLREILGHQPREVSAGALLGIALAAVFNYDRLGPVLTFVQTLPTKPEIYAWAIGFGVLIVGGIVARLIISRRYKKSPTMRRLARRVTMMSQTIGWVGLFATFLVFERASYFAWRLWPLLAALTGLIWAIGLATASYKMVPAELAQEATKARKLRWLNWGKSRKAKR